MGVMATALWSGAQARGTATTAAVYLLALLAQAFHNFFLLPYQLEGQRAEAGRWLDGRVSHSQVTDGVEKGLRQATVKSKVRVIRNERTLSGPG